MKHSTRINTGISLLLSILAAGCSEDVAGNVRTVEGQPNGVLSSGESTSAEMDCQIKNSCSMGIYVEWEACLTEKLSDGREVITIDLNERKVCTSFRTDFDCVNRELVQTLQSCTGGYCNYILPTGGMAGAATCGWKLTYFQAYNADGTPNGSISVDNLEDFGYELLPVSN